MRKDFIEEHMMLGLNIAYYRRARRLTQEKLAEKVGVSRNHMSRIEIGIVSSVSLDVIFAIAKELNVPVHKLFEAR